MTELSEAVWSATERARIERLCAVLTGDPSTAGDLAQETLLQAWRIRHRLVDPTGSGPWLDAVARNVCRRWRAERARRSAHEHSTHVDPPPEGDDPIDRFLERDELVGLLDRALALLPAETRDALVGRYVEERTPQELAAELGTSAEAISMRLVRGRTRLRELLETDLADEPLAGAWRARYGVGWRTTRLHCPECGRPTVTWRRDEARAVVELSCSTCGPGDVSSAYRLDNPALAPHLRDARRPSTVVARMASWSATFWPSVFAGPIPCTRCSRPVRARTYQRPAATDARTARGWQVLCHGCGEQLTSSLGGLVLALPETRELRARRPRLRAVPSRRELVGGRDAVVVGYRDDVSGDRVEAVFDDATSRLLRVVSGGAPLRTATP